MANKTVYPFGTGGQLPSNIGIINDLTTGGADKALSAEQGKALNEMVKGDLYVNSNLTISAGSTYTFKNFSTISTETPCVVKITGTYGHFTFNNSGWDELARYNYASGQEVNCIVPANTSIIYVTTSESTESAININVLMYINSLQSRVYKNSADIAANYDTLNTAFSAKIGTQIVKEDAFGGERLIASLFKGNVRLEDLGYLNGYVDAVTVGNVDSTLTAHSTRATTRNYIPIIDKITVSLKTSYAISICWFNEKFVSLGSSGWMGNGTYTAPNGTAYAKFNFYKGDATQTLSNDINDVLNSIVVHSVIDVVDGVKIECKDYTDYFADKTYQNTSFDLTQMTLTGGAIASDGTITANTYFKVTDYIPIKPLSALYVKAGYSDSRLKIAFYKTNPDNTRTLVKLLSYVNGESTDTTKIINEIDYTTPSGADCVRVNFLKSYNGKVSSANLGSCILTCDTVSSVTKKDVVIEDAFVNGICRVNDYTSWRKCYTIWNGEYVMQAKSYSTIKPIKIIPGHTYQMWCIYDTRLNTGSNVFMEIRTGNAELQTPGWTLFTFNRGNRYTFTAPRGEEYMYIRVLFSEDVEISDCEGLDVFVVDNTHNSALSQSKTRLIDLAFESGKRYAQGMGVSNGFVFQGFQTYASATDQTNLEIYDLSTKQLVQKLMIGDNDYHLNTIQFGDKYDNSDPFGILWVCGDMNIHSTTSNGETVYYSRIYGYRISYDSEAESPFSLTQVYEVHIPQDDSTRGDFDQIIDFKNKKIVQYSIYKDGVLHDTYVQVFTYSNALTSSTVLTKSYSFTLPAFKYCQSSVLYDNILWCVVGTPSDAMGIYAIDYVRGKLVKVIDMRNSYFGFDADEEPQAIGKYEDGIYFSTTRGFYKLTI